MMIKNTRCIVLIVSLFGMTLAVGCASQQAKFDSSAGPAVVYSASDLEAQARCDGNTLAASDSLGAQVFGSQSARYELAQLRNVDLPVAQDTPDAIPQSTFADVPVDE